MRFAIFTVLAFVCVTHISATDEVPIDGGLSPIEKFDTVISEINDVLLQIEEVHNKKYILDEVLNAQSQVVAGRRLVGEAHFLEDNGDDKKKCTFDIVIRAWERYRSGKLSCHPEFKELVVVRGPIRD